MTEQLIHRHTHKMGSYWIEVDLNLAGVLRDKKTQRYREDAHVNPKAETGAWLPAKNTQDCWNGQRKVQLDLSEGAWSC